MQAVEEIDVIRKFAQTSTSISEERRTAFSTIEGVINLGLRVINASAHKNNAPLTARFIETDENELSIEIVRLWERKSPTFASDIKFYFDNTGNVRGNIFYAGRQGGIGVYDFFHKPGRPSSEQNIPLSDMTTERLQQELYDWILALSPPDIKSRIEAGETMEQIAGTDSTAGQPKPRR